MVKKDIIYSSLDKIYIKFQNYFIYTNWRIMSNENNSTQIANAFETFGLKSPIMKSIKEAGFKVPSPIQEQAIPIILSGKDVVGQAHTGTGKTAAFGLPVLNNLQGDQGVEVLVITPTRELANQVSDELYSLGKYLGVKTVTVYGGMSSYKQIRFIHRGAQVVVATPGRLLDMLSSDQLPNFNPATVILDEADEMLDMGFLDDIKEIFKYLPSERQTLLFSATMPAPIKDLAKEILEEPEFITVTKQETTNKDIKQLYYVIEDRERDDAVIRLIDSQEAEKSIIFCRTKKEVDRVATMLIAYGFSAKGLHGDMEQPQREEAIKSFKSGALDILVATDVAARGLNVSDVTHVFNYHIPFDAESYVHRIGRTGRAGKKGIAITLVTPLEFRELQRIKKVVGTKMEHCFIPTIKEVKESQVSALVDSIRKQSVNDEAHKILDVLEEEFDLATISYKVISYLLETQKVAGPDKIGIEPKKLERLLSRFSNDRNRNGRNNNHNGRRRRHGGGRRHSDNRDGGRGRRNNNNRNNNR